VHGLGGGQAADESGDVDQLHSRPAVDAGTHLSTFGVGVVYADTNLSTFGVVVVYVGTNLSTFWNAGTNMSTSRNAGTNLSTFGTCLAADERGDVD